MSATQSLLGPSASNSRATRSGDAEAPSLVVVTQSRRHETPAIPAFRISLAIRLVPTRRPSTSASSARIRGAPQVPSDISWMALMRAVSAASSVARLEGGRLRQA
jgi:hypothetical protein